MAQHSKTTKVVVAPISPAIKGLAMGAMITGIIGVVFSWIPFWGFIIGAAALTLGIIGLVKKAPNHGMALAGTILGGAAIILNILATIILIALSIALPNDTSSSEPVPQPYPYFKD